jgi:hypothetical protein
MPLSVAHQKQFLSHYFFSGGFFSLMNQDFTSARGAADGYQTAGHYILSHQTSLSVRLHNVLCEQPSIE